MHLVTRVAFGALLLSPAALAAQTAAPAQQPAANAAGVATAAAATPTVGATVYDSAGVEVGRIEQITPQAVVVNLGTSKVGLPPASIGSGPKGLTVSITRDQVLAAAQQAQAGAQAQVQSQLTPGTTIRGAAGATVGTVKANDGKLVTLTTPKGDVALPINGFGPGPNGPIIGMTQAQLDAAIEQAGGGANAAASGSADAEATDATTVSGAQGATAASGTTGDAKAAKPAAKRPNR